MENGKWRMEKKGRESRGNVAVSPCQNHPSCRILKPMTERYERIRGLREDADLTQRQVGEALHVSQRTYAYYESGQRMVPPGVLCALAELHNVSVDYIPGRTDRKETNR